ncbi:tyrosine-type recombinase/integrase [Paraperlucidibaca sp.]|uniref:tyrosine-type recombinase/integrase n=1 Tax=Paraperlucidibaca sp. TaxID=2708021 RepID=UPI0030F49503
MASVRALPSKMLFVDFKYLGERFRETSLLVNTPTNMKAMTQMAKRLEAEITIGAFSYEKYFPQSKHLEKVRLLELRSNQGRSADQVPTFEEHVKDWLAEHEVEWRFSYCVTINNLLNKHIKPGLGTYPLDAITRDVLISLRSDLTKYRTPGGDGLSACTINRIMTISKAIIEDGCIRYKLISPFDRIKKLKEEKTHVDPFRLDEINAMIADIRSDYRDYLITRVFTGVRSAEIHGLRWKCVDFDRREILIRETFSQGRFEYTKNDPSQREIAMSKPVYEALKRQFEVTGGNGGEGLVFCTKQGTPIDAKNFANRVWRPMLKDLDITYRRPYDTRHTCATLWLASGEAPEWVARQLGHANTQMLFSVYSRFVPNHTRSDGSAFERLLASSVVDGGAA